MTAPWTNTGRVLAGTTTLEYGCMGPAPCDAPTLVLLHEGLGCISLWRDFPAALAQATRCGVLVYSRAGYGYSDPVTLPRPLDYLAQEALTGLPRMLNALGIEQAILLGHSDGASIAALYAGCANDLRVLGTVLIAPHFFTEAAAIAQIRAARDAFNSGNLRKRLAKHHADPDNAFRGWNDAWLHPDFLTWNIVECLDTIRTPVLAIQGRDDPYGSLDQIDVVVRRVCHAPVSTLILDQCQHAPHIEHDKPVVAAIAGFCESVASTSTSPAYPD